MLKSNKIFNMITLSIMITNISYAQNRGYFWELGGYIYSGNTSNPVIAKVSLIAATDHFDETGKVLVNAGDVIAYVWSRDQNCVVANYAFDAEYLYQELLCPEIVGYGNIFYGMVKVRVRWNSQDYDTSVEFEYNPACDNDNPCYEHTPPDCYADFDVETLTFTRQEQPGYPMYPNNFVFTAPNDYDFQNYDYHWFGTINVVNDVVIPSNRTLTIEPGTIVKFSNGKKLTVYGTLIAEGTSEDRIVFTSASANPSPGDWTWIRFYYSNNSRMSYANIEYATYGTLLYHSSPTIENCRFENNVLAIYPFYSNSYIYSNMITNNTYGTGAIYMYRSSPTLRYNTITYNDNRGIYCNSYSSPNLASYDGNPGENIIAYNGNVGLQAYNRSDPDLGSCTYPCHTSITGENSIYLNSSYEVRAQSESDVTARNNWWGDDGGQFYTDGSSTIDRSYPLPTDPNTGRPLSKTLASSEDEWIHPEMNDFTRGVLNQSLGNYNLAIGHYRNVVAVQPHSEMAVKSLINMNSCFNLINAVTSNIGIEHIISMHTNCEIGGIARELKVAWLLKRGDKQQALSLLRSIRTLFPDNDEMVKNSLFNEGVIHLFEYENIDSAQILFNELASLYPLDQLVLDSRLLMGEPIDIGFFKAVEDRISEDYNDALLPERFALFHNYPNPFNPVTTIEYQLPEESMVVLKMHDIMGREIKTLFTGKEAAGLKKIIWDGKDNAGSPVASGMYIYTISAISKESQKEFHQSRKMVLLR